MSKSKAKKPAAAEGPTITLDAELVGAIFTAARNGTGYMNCTRNAHATKVDPEGTQVRVELEDEDGGRKTVVVAVPDELTLTVIPDAPDAE